MRSIPDGANLGKYRLLAALGQGGTADVFLAVAQGSAGFNKLLVLKLLRSHVGEDRDDEGEPLTMFLDEARLAARLNHPNVVQTLEVGEHKGRYYLAMEHLDGQPLDRLIARAAKSEAGAPLSAVVRVLADALAGLDYAHALADYDGSPLGVVHRDVSPHNIFVTYDGHVKVVDFGIAKVAGRSSATQTGMLKGKIAYMAPEQALGGPIDRRADIFSAGVMLWEALAGRRLWASLTDVQVLTRLVNAEIPPLPPPAAARAPALAAACARALSFRPEDRYPDAAAFQAELEAYLDAEGGAGATRELAGLLNALFAADRARLRASVDAQLRAFRADSLRATTDLALQIEKPPRELTPNATAAPLRPRPAGRAHVFLLISGLALALVALGLRCASGESAALHTQDDAPVASAAPPAEVRVAFHASPPGARLFLDDVALPSNPFVGSLRRDGAPHRLRAEAPGFLSKQEQVAFSADASVALVLAPAPASEARPPFDAASPSSRTPAPPRPVPKRATPSAQPPGSPEAAGPPAPAYLDRTDPWAH